MLVAVTADPLAPTVSAGVAAGRGKRKISTEARRRAREIRDAARATGTQAEAVAQLLGFVAKYPSAEFLQKIIARLLHEMGDDDLALATWRGIVSRHPNSTDAFRNLVLLTSRREGPQAVRAIVDSRFSGIPTSFEELVVYADACDRAGARAEADQAFRRLAELLRRRRGSWLSAASWLEGQGRYRLTAKLLRRVAGWTGFARPMMGEIHYIDSILDDFAEAPHLRPVRPSKPSAVPAVSMKVLEGLFNRAIQERANRQLSMPAEASIVMITGSLGCGGAERQLVNTAIGLAEFAEAGAPVPGGGRLGAVTIIARSLKSRADGEHFVADLRCHGIAIKDYQELGDFGGDLGNSVARPLLTALRFLPWAVAEGVVKLTDTLRELNPAVVHIWQDGMVYATGLAALLAGAPRIVLSARSVPPPDRPRRYLPEYDVIYRSLLAASGVSLSVNSQHAADRYAAWLGADPDSIEVIRNGVLPPGDERDTLTEQKFATFAARTPDATFTLGAVMRIDQNKRPLFWVEAAAKLVDVMPTVRFIVVGDGSLRAQMMRRAESLNVAHRFLFVGRSSYVGYWLSKMDAFLLTSEHEGLPNALIEAQLRGLPVITTPAGGALEALVEDLTGIVIGHAATPQEVAGRILELASRPDRLQTMGAAAERWARSNFPTSQMLQRTLELYFPQQMADGGAAGWAAPHPSFSFDQAADGQ